MENNTDVDFGVYVDDTSVNGFMVYGSMVAYAYSGCVTYEELDFLSSDMEENDIDSIEEVSFTMYAYNRENGKLWTTDEIIVGQVPSESLPLQPEETQAKQPTISPKRSNPLPPFFVIQWSIISTILRSCATELRFMLIYGSPGMQ